MDTPIEKSLDRLEESLSSHTKQDNENFNSLFTQVSDLKKRVENLENKFFDMKNTIETKVEDLSDHLSKKLDDVTGKVSLLERDKIRAEGFAQGASQSKKPGPWTSILLPALIAASVTVAVTMLSAEAVKTQLQQPIIVQAK